ncbi:MAG: hypothetical protein K0U78_06745 [Actinomycetia bacterium]|nr:hypothetical protein [Actinomycetes bacterium]
MPDRWRATVTSSTPPQTSADPTPDSWMTTPVIDYEPAPSPLGRLRTPLCPTPSGEALRRSPHPARRPSLQFREPPPPKSAVVFAETALRQVIEVIDRRRPVAQLRPLMTPVLVDRVIAHAGTAHRGSAAIRRVRVRAVDTGTDSPVGPPAGSRADPRDDAGVRDTDQHSDVRAAEVFASCARSGRIHALAARIERHKNGWRMVALQIG